MIWLSHKSKWVIWRWRCCCSGGGSRCCSCRCCGGSSCWDRSRCRCRGSGSSWFLSSGGGCCCCWCLGSSCCGRCRWWCSGGDRSRYTWSLTWLGIVSRFLFSGRWDWDHTSTIDYCQRDLVVGCNVRTYNSVNTIPLPCDVLPLQDWVVSDVW